MKGQVACRSILNREAWVYDGPIGTDGQVVLKLICGTRVHGTRLRTRKESKVNDLDVFYSSV